MSNLIHCLLCKIRDTRHLFHQRIPCRILEFIKYIYNCICLGIIISLWVHKNRACFTDRLHDLLEAICIHDCFCHRHINIFNTFYIRRNITDNRIQREQNRHLDQHREASTCHGSSILLINKIDLFLLLHH